jgi:hypothetical protein
MQNYGNISYARMVARIHLTYAPLIRNFVQVMRHEKPFVFLRIARLKMGRLIIWGSIVGVKCFESCEAAF